MSERIFVQLRRLHPLTLLLGFVLICLLVAALVDVSSGVVQIPTGQATLFGPPANYIKGSVIVIVQANSSDAVSGIMNKYKLNYFESVSKAAGNNHYVQVSVPIGEETQWINTFKKDPSVLDARYLLTTDQ